MANRERLLLLTAPIVLSACVRWGIPDEDDFGCDYGYGYGCDYDSTTYDYTTYDYTTTTTTDPDSTSDESTTGTEQEPTRRPPPWPEQWPFGLESRLVVWGLTGIPTVNLELLSNTLYFLAGAVPGEGPLTILWIADCDPRTDPDGCMLGDVQPFFDMVDGLGTIELASPAMIEPSAYDVVVADFCGTVDGEQIAALLAAGEGVLALGDRSCITANGSSAKVANETIAHFGVRFGHDELYEQRYPVPIEAQSGLLEGVTSLEPWGVSLQETIEPVSVVLDTADGVLLSSRSER